MDIRVADAQLTSGHRALGCLAGLAVGNVLGLVVEPRSREEAPAGRSLYHRSGLALTPERA